jgi:hypothetical protein
MLYLQSTNQNLGNFWGLAMKVVGIFYGHLVYFEDIGIYILYGHLVHLFIFLYIFPRFGKYNRKKSGNPGLDHQPRKRSIPSFQNSLSWIDTMNVLLLFFFFLYGSLGVRGHGLGLGRWAPHHGSRVEEGELLTQDSRRYLL